MILDTPQANSDVRFKTQAFDAASSVEANIAEGWHRFTVGEMLQFFRYGLASLAEAKRHVHDGIDRRYFTANQCQQALTLGDRCGAALMNLHKSLRPFVAARKTRSKERLKC